MLCKNAGHHPETHSGSDRGLVAVATWALVQRDVAVSSAFAGITVSVSPDSRCRGTWPKVYWARAAPRTRVNVQMTSNRSPSQVWGMAVPGLRRQRRGERRDVVMLPADQHDTRVAADHAGGQLGFLPLGEGGDYLQSEAIAESLDGLMRPVRCRLGWVPVGGREQGCGGAQSRLRRPDGGIEEHSERAGALRPSRQQGMRVLIALFVDPKGRLRAAGDCRASTGGSAGFSPWRVM